MSESASNSTMLGAIRSSNGETQVRHTRIVYDCLGDLARTSRSCRGV